MAALVGLALIAQVATGVGDVAAEAGVDEVALQGALNTLGLAAEDARAYLVSVGDLVEPKPPPDATDRLISCLAWAESRNNPRAYNARSGASGLLQYLPSTWAGTPQGRAGASIWDPAAQWAATRWMLSQGRLHEWSTWRQCA